jgi:RNA polymerase sigma factor (sigma-70 family)
VGKHAEEHLRRFLAARAGADAVEMRRWWEELVIDFYDRMDGFIYAAHKGRLDEQEHEQALELALIRFSTRLCETFAGTSMGELVNATRTLARGICMDVQRSAIRARRAVALEDAYTLEESSRRYEVAAEAADARDFVAWALPQLDEPRRRVLELTLHGAEIGEIMQELEITRDNAYQRRSRAIKDLAKLKELYDT